MDTTILYYKKIDDCSASIVGCKNRPQTLEIPKEIDGLSVVALEDFAFAIKEEMPLAEEKTTPATLQFVEVNSVLSASLSQESGFALEHLFLPDTIKHLGIHAFEGCSALKHLVLPEGMQKIPAYTFSGCKNLSHVGLPSGLELLGEYAFFGCSSIEKIVLPQSLLSVEKYAFYNCRNLQTIHIPPDCASLGMGIFLNCDRLFDIYIEQGNHLSEIVSGLHQALRLTITFSDGMAQVLLPDYQSEYIENTPARMLSQVHYGSGHVYRQCVGKYAVDFRQYDKLFYMAKREDAGVLALQMVLGRLLYPYRLHEEYQRIYLEYLAEHFLWVVEYLLQNKEEYIVEKLGEWNLFTKENLSQTIHLAQKMGKTALVGYLLHHQKITFGEDKKKKSFDL